MSARYLMAILGTTLVCSVGNASVTYAQEQGMGQVASETASEKHNSASKTDESAETSAVTKTSQGTPTGLVGRFFGDQREIWKSPARLRFSDTEWLVPLSGITAGPFGAGARFQKNPFGKTPNNSPSKTRLKARVAGLGVGGTGSWVLRA